MYIRPATRDEMKALVQLIDQSIRLTNANDYSPDVINRTCLLFTEEKLVECFFRRDVFVAVEGLKIVGTISLGSGKVQNFFVAPNSQKQGIGEELLNHVEAHAIEIGLMELGVSSSITAMPYYRKRGYKLLHFEEKDDGSTWAMVKSIQKKN